MTWRNVRLIWLRELQDQLRDRRTLFMVAVLPLLLYPSLGIGMMQLTLLFSEQPRTVVVLNASQLPAPPLLDGPRFAADWFEQADEAEKLVVWSDLDPASLPPEALPLQAKALQWQPKLVRLEELEGLREADAVQEWQAIRQEIGAQFSSSGVQVLVIIPPGFAKSLQDLSAAVKGGTGSAFADYPRPLVVHNSADERSSIAFRRVRDVLRLWETRMIDLQLRENDLPAALSRPVRARALDMAENVQISAGIWGKLFPGMLIMMAVTGAFYPAIDLAAGEKERGTMETLLICPATRTEIVIGKFLTVLVFSISTALLNLTSLGFTSGYLATLASGSGGRLESLSPPPLSSLIWVFVLLVPLAALFSALCLALATFARSSKEGQYYLTPMLLVTTGLTVFCLSPGIEIQPFYSMMPVMGPSLLLKALLVARGDLSELSPYLPMVLLSSAGYCALALWWAIDQFSSEEVLFREAERFDVRLWIKHIFRTKEPTPSFSEAAFCFVLIMLLQFSSMKYLQEPLRVAETADRGTLMMQLLIVQQLVIIATPAMLMGIMLTTSLRQTFGIRWPGWRFLAGGVLLAITLHPLTLTFAGLLQQWRFFPELPKGIQEVMGQITSPNQPTWLLLLAFALAPGICEEIAFRGFLLNGFGRNGRWRLAIVLSAIAFGVIHMIPQQVLNASMLGVLLGLLAVRSRSLFPGIAFHISYNGLEVLRHRYGSQLPSGGVYNLFWKHTAEQSIVYQPLLLLLCAVVLTATVWWLIQRQAFFRRRPTDLPEIAQRLS